MIPKERRNNETTEMNEKKVKSFNTYFAFFCTSDALQKLFNRN